MLSKQLNVHGKLASVFKLQFSIFFSVVAEYANMYTYTINILPFQTTAAPSTAMWPCWPFTADSGTRMMMRSDTGREISLWSPQGRAKLTLLRRSTRWMSIRENWQVKKSLECPRNFKITCTMCTVQWVLKHISFIRSALYPCWLLVLFPRCSHSRIFCLSLNTRVTIPRTLSSFLSLTELTPIQ